MEFHLRSSKPSLNSLNLFNLLPLLETCLFFEYDEQRTVHRFFRQGAPSSRLSLSLRIQCKLAERANCTDLTNHLWKKTDICQWRILCCCNSKMTSYFGLPASYQVSALVLGQERWSAREHFLILPMPAVAQSGPCQAWVQTLGNE